MVSLLAISAKPVIYKYKGPIFEGTRTEYGIASGTPLRVQKKKRKRVKMLLSSCSRCEVSGSQRCEMPY